MILKKKKKIKMKLKIIMEIKIKIKMKIMNYNYRKKIMNKIKVAPKNKKMRMLWKDQMIRIRMIEMVHCIRKENLI